MLSIKEVVKRNRIALSWFLSYLLVLCVTLITNIYMYNRIENSVKKQININNIEIINNKKQYIDNTQRSISNICLDLAYDPSVQEIASYDNMDLSCMSKIPDIRKKISQKNYLGFAADKIFIYMPSIDYIISATGCTDSRLFFNGHYNDKNIGYNDFMSVLQEKNVGRYIEIPNKNNQSDPSVLCLYSVPGNGTNSVATVAVEVTYSQFTNYNVNSEIERYLCILDGTNNLVFSDPGYTEEAKQAIADVLPNITDNHIVHNHNSFFLTVNSNENNWKYTFVIDSKAYMQEVYAMRKIMSVLMALYAIICVVLAYFMTVKNQKPIRSIANRINTSIQNNTSETKSLDEIQYINTLISQIIDENEAYSSKVELQKNTLRDAIFMKIMHNNVDIKEEPYDDMLDGIDVKFVHSYFNLILFYIEDYTSIFFEEHNNDAQESMENYQLAKFIITNIFKDMINKEYMCVFCDLGGILCCVINSDDENAPEEISKTLSGEKTFILDNFNVDFMAGVSLAHKGVTQLSLCYNEAIECLEYKFFNYSDVITYDMLRNTNAGNIYYFPIETEFKLINNLKSGNGDESINMIKELFRVNFEDSTPTMQSAKCLIYEIMGIIARVISDDDSMDTDKMDFFKQIDSCKTVNSMKDVIIKSVSEICENNAHYKNGRVAKIVDESKQYIDENYADPELSGASIAEHFNVNYSYMSSVFKKQISEGMLAYITKVRIEHAVELLNTTGLTIKEIATKCGYTNMRTFSRVFVKSIGVTPGNFRNKGDTKK